MSIFFYLLYSPETVQHEHFAYIFFFTIGVLCAPWNAHFILFVSSCFFEFRFCTPRSERLNVCKFVCGFIQFSVVVTFYYTFIHVSFDKPSRVEKKLLKHFILFVNACVHVWVWRKWKSLTCAHWRRDWIWLAITATHVKERETKTEKSASEWKRKTQRERECTHT